MIVFISLHDFLCRAFFAKHVLGINSIKFYTAKVFYRMVYQSLYSNITFKTNTFSVASNRGRVKRLLLLYKQLTQITLHYN